MRYRKSLENRINQLAYFRPDSQDSVFKREVGNFFARQMSTWQRRASVYRYVNFNSVEFIMHIGGHLGQERNIYELYKVPVFWVEPIPHIFQQLKINLVGWRNQHCFENVVNDTRDVVRLRISSNNGASSSIMDPSKHLEMYPEIKFENYIDLISVTLGDMIEKCYSEISSASRGGLLVLDTQGNELNILRDSKNLELFRTVICEVSNFESYVGCTQEFELVDFMNEQGFFEVTRVTKDTSKYGAYWDIVFSRNNA